MIDSKKITDCVCNILEHDNNLRLYMSEGLVNFTAFAKKYRTQIEAELGSPCQLSSISMAARRYIRQSESYLPKKVNFDIVIANKIIDYNINCSPEVLSDVMDLYNSVGDREMTISLYKNNLTLIATEHIEPLIKLKKSINDNIKFRVQDLACFHLFFKGDFLNTPGIIYSILKLLQSKGVNILELFSNATELQLVLKEINISTTYELLDNYLKSI